MSQIRIQRPLHGVAYSVLEGTIDATASTQEIESMVSKMKEVEDVFIEKGQEVDIQLDAEYKALKDSCESLSEDNAKFQLMLRWYKTKYGDEVYAQMAKEVSASPALKSIAAHSKNTIKEVSPKAKK